MYLERKFDLSVYYWLKDLFSATTFVTVVDGFPDTELTLPTVSVDLKTIVPRVGELGNRNRVETLLFTIDVFAKNKSQRDEFAFKILNGLEDSIQVNNYDEGYPPSVTPSQIGCLLVGDIRMDIIRIYPELVNTMYYRASITFEAEYNQF